MQTSKIKPGETYAMDRRGDLVRFVVQSILTTKTRSKTSNKIEGYIEEDRKEGESVPVRQVDPERLIGPYEEQTALVERKAQEEAARKAKLAERDHLANLDRLALYRFVGVAPPQTKPGVYSGEMFHIGYGGSVDIRSEGVKAVIAKVRALQAEVQGMEPLPPGLRIVKGE